MNDNEFQKIFLARKTDDSRYDAEESWTSTFEQFLSFVSKNFELKKFRAMDCRLICEEHGVIVYYDREHITEPELMAAIGKHLDKVPHVWEADARKE